VSNGVVCGCDRAVGMFMVMGPPVEGMDRRQARADVVPVRSAQEAVGHTLAAKAD
jgi:hypothetical protein